MGKGSILTLILLVLFGVFAFFGMTGAKVDIYRMDPWYEKVSLGLDLTGGGCAVYQAEREDMPDAEFSEKFKATMRVLRARLDDKGYIEATVAAQGADRVRVEIPDSSLGSKPDKAAFFSTLFTPAVLELKSASGDARVTGDMVQSAAALRAAGDGPAVKLQLNAQGTRIFTEMTTAAFRTGDPIHIVLDGVTISSPVVEQRPVTDGVLYISGDSAGRFSQQRAEDLAAQLKSGALPLKLSQTELKSIGASLGEGALSGILLAGLAGACLLFLFMIFFYRLPGLLACVSLLVSGALILLSLAAIPALQLTLPGVAGLILGIVMAAGANVNIFERFKEELRGGRTLSASLTTGSTKAMRAILDAHIVAMIAAVVVALFGAGAFKGFGYTLIIGLAASLFTAAVVTRTLMRLAIALKIRNPKLYTNIAAQKAVKGGE